MSKIFCPDCGVQHSFLDRRPKFCTECGYSFGATASKPAQRATAEVVEAEVESEDSDYNVPTIDASELNIGPRPVLTVQQALAHPAPDSNFSRSGPGAKGLRRLQDDVRSKRNNEI